MNQRGTKNPNWICVRGYNREVAGNVPANTLISAPALIFPPPGSSPLIEVPSMSLITIITHFGTYAGDLGAYGTCAWISNGLPFPYNYLVDQMGQNGQPLELSDQMEISPGVGFQLLGINSDAVAHKIGWVIRAEQGYYK